MGYEISYKTNYGVMYHSKCEDILSDSFFDKFPGVNLILTSPPFPLNRAKQYGNMTGQEYLEWLKKLAVLFSRALTDDGSIVIELGNAWEPGKPVQSTLPMESLLMVVQFHQMLLSLQILFPMIVILSIVKKTNVTSILLECQERFRNSLYVF